MGIDLRKTDLKITSDPRLRAGIRAALECICERHGLSKSEQHELAGAVEKQFGDELQTCEAAGCAVSINESEEKIEVSVTPTAHANGAGSSAHETNVAEDSRSGKTMSGSTPHAKRNGSGVIFVKHFHKNAARS